MKRFANILLITIIILTVVGVIAVPHQAEASFYDFLKCTFNPSECVAGSLTNWMYSLFAELGNAILTMMSWVVTLAGSILNVSIILTMNIKVIYDSTPAIEQVWVIIRNISSLFIIFGLLYTSIATILDVGKPNLRGLVVKIVIAGLLINFSLFFTKVLIDGSNLISLSIYRAIAPGSVSALSSDYKAEDLLGLSKYDGGLSAIFMQNLKIPNIWNNKQGLITNNTSQNYLNIAIATFFGSFLMVVAALSFFAAAIAFTIRLVFLLLLMGFSPVFFVGMIFPALKKEFADKWWDYLSKQLIFMPVYLLFMYVALRFMSSDGGKSFFSALDLGKNSVGQGPMGTLYGSVGLLMQYTIAFVLINIPLLAALKTGAVGIKWAEGANKTLHGLMGQHTFGRAAKAASGAVASSGWAARNPNMAILANNALKGVSGGSFGGSKGGYDKRFKDYSKERSDYGSKSLGLTKAQRKSIDENEKKLKIELANLKTSYANNVTRANDMRLSETARALAQKAATEQETKIKEAEKNIKDQRSALEGKASRDRKEEFASNLEKGSDFITTKARKDAADAIRKEMAKGKDKKALDAIKDLFSEDKKDEGGGGGDKPKDK